MIKIGDTVVPKRCSTEYQTANKMTVKYIKMSRFNTICDGENMVGKYASASENGWSWFPLSTLELAEVNHALL